MELAKLLPAPEAQEPMDCDELEEVRTNGAESISYLTL